MISQSKWNQYGLPNASIKGIVIHNTNSNYSARELEKIMKNGNFNNGCHFFVDYEEVIQMMPLTWSVWNTGKGMDFGNTKCIAIEICTNLNNRLYLQGQDRAVELIRNLMEEFHLTKKDIYFHRDFQPNINCPAQILKLYGSKENFLKRI